MYPSFPPFAALKAIREVGKYDSAAEILGGHLLVVSTRVDPPICFVKGKVELTSARQRVPRNMHESILSSAGRQRCLLV